jgi:two-component system chemotaxis sensor kinase CheA
MSDDLLEQFIVESRELVLQATDDLLALEYDQSAGARLDSAFRAVHTLKGSVGLFDFAPMGIALHAAEDLLGALRAGRAVVSDAVIDTLLECIGQTERWVEAIEQTGHLPPDAARIGHRLARAQQSHLEPADTGIPRTLPLSEAPWAQDLLASAGSAAGSDAGEAPLVAIRYLPGRDCFFAGDDPMALLRKVPDLLAMRISGRDPWPPASELDPFACNLRIEALSGAALEEVRTAFRFVPDQVSLQEISRPHGASALEDNSVGHASAASRAGASRTMRIDAARVDQMADLVGEMVIAKNALAQLAARASAGIDQNGLAEGLQASHAAIHRLVAEMHKAVTDIRMLPLRDAFRRFPRAVRDIAGQAGKTIAFSMEGQHIEADKSIVEGLFEPLLHVIRNAIAHGAEPESDRVAVGKPAQANVSLRARRDGDQIVVEVTDDGCGIDPAKIRRMAVDRGLVPQDSFDRMTDAEALDLIFAPGFSTASEVTDLSGRGVGMDAVRNAVEAFGGRVSVQSVQGRGTTVRLSAPLAVVMSQVMTVRVGRELYGIPIDGVVETVLVPARHILPVGGGEAFVLRDRTVPLLRLADLLNTHGAVTGSGVKVVVMPVRGDLVGLAVDGFAERMDVLMRPLTGILAGLPGVMGTTVRGDGRVLMILDVPELVG